MTRYHSFTKALEGSFAAFVQSEEVNRYLQTIGGDIKTEVLQDGILSEFLVISSYEEARGNWATAYDNKIRFGNQVVGANDINTPMVLTPNFFYGTNQRGEEIEYRLGLVKGKTNIKVFPVILRKTGTGIIARGLDDLCVVHRGVSIDPETARLMAQEQVAGVTAYQYFLACFWNVDDYIRKKNPQFHSDFDIDVWTAVEVFSGRIVDQMLRKIAGAFVEEPDWLIPQAEAAYRHGIIDWIEKCLMEGSEISENQILILVKNLCSYMCRFNNFQPLEALAKTGTNLLPFMMQNFRNPNNEVRKEAFNAFELALEKTPQFITEIFPTILEMFGDEDTRIRDLALRSFHYTLEATSDLIDQSMVHKLFDLLSDAEKGIRKNVLRAIEVLLEYNPSLIDQAMINRILDHFADPSVDVKCAALQTYNKAIEKNPSFITLHAINWLHITLADQDRSVKHTSFQVYKAAFKAKTPLIDQMMYYKTLLNLINHVSYSKLEVLDTYSIIITAAPELLKHSQVQIILDLCSHPHRHIKQAAFQCYRLIVKKIPQFVNKQGIKIILNQFTYLSKYIRRSVLDLYKLVLETMPHLIDQNGVNYVLDRFSDLDKHVRRAAIDLYKIIIKKFPHLTDPHGTRKVRTLLADLDPVVSKSAREICGLVN